MVLFVRPDPSLPRPVQSLIFGAAVALPFVAVVLISGLRAQGRTGIPFFRNVVFLRDFVQAVFLFVIFVVAFTLAANLFDNLAASGLSINFGVIERKFGTEVTEGPDPRQPLEFLAAIPVVGQSLAQATVLQPDTVFRALLVGFINTLRVVALSLVATTVLGVLVGIGLLSVNWLVRTVSAAYVEIFRNTPLLVQLFFIYGGVIKALPSRPREAMELPGSIFVTGRGLYYPAVIATDAADIFFLSLLLGVILGVGLWRWRLRLNERTGKPAYAVRYFLLAVLGLGGVGLALSLLGNGMPFVLDMPQVGNFNFIGGASFSAEYLALFLGLTLYTSAFVADIVRAGIQSVAKGQIEAAHALGLSNVQTLSKIILPQALRLAVPPLTNQYLNLTKNSSLGIAIGFTDIYNVATITYNQTGQSVALFAILMVVYLSLSLLISLVMNLFNSRLQFKTR
ncbi:MAG: ABC transporter permease subunit [Chloroflexi bacterium]|nr:ABC transporter permease subunit [Chloroflexota bacterium]